MGKQENYGRTKETHAHTQALWEKEIRRARKETFKAQSSFVKLQEELKSARTSQKSVEDELEREKERSKAREQEAFAARYSLVGVQEQLDQALEKVKILEQERDAFKTLAKNEEDVARIAAEGKLPLPPSQGQVSDDEFASPKKRPRMSSINIVDVQFSATSEAEIEELTRLWLWEKQRADRAVEHVQFLEVECQLRVCAASKCQSRDRGSTIRPTSRNRKRPSNSRITDAGDMLILSENGPSSPTPKPSPKRSKTERLREDKELRRSTVFVPAEGIFRTISQYEAESAPLRGSEIAIPSIEHPPHESISSQPPTPSDRMPQAYARTPSVEPPDFAMLAKQRTSLLSLLDAEHRQDGHAIIFNIPTTPGPAVAAKPLIHHINIEPEIESPAGSVRNQDDDDADTQTTMTTMTTGEYSPTQRLSMAAPLPAIPVSEQQQEQQPVSATTTEEPYQYQEPLAETEAQQQQEEEEFTRASAILSMTRPHTSANHYSTTKVTVTKVPLREENKDPNMAARLMKLQRAPSMSRLAGDKPSFDVNNPALTPP